MTTKQYVYLALTFIFLLFAVGSDWYMQKAPNLSKYQQGIEAYLHKHESTVDAFIKDKGLIHRLLKASSSTPLQEEQDFQTLKILASEPFTINIFQGDSLIFLE